MDVQWTFTEDQFNVFEVFFKEELDNGSLEFGIELEGVEKGAFFWEGRYRTVRSDGAHIVQAALRIDVADLPLPEAIPQELTTPEDTPLNITLTGTNPIEGSLFFKKVSGPSHGTLTGGTGAARTYTPSLNYNGPDSFTFLVGNGFGLSAPALVNITVTPVNDRPTAIPAVYQTVCNGGVVDSMHGDDVDGDSLTFEVMGWESGIVIGDVIIMATEMGELTYNRLTGVFSYLLDPDIPIDENGADDAWNFRVFDGELYSIYVSVQVHVIGPCTPPPDDSGSGSGSDSGSDSGGEPCPPELIYMETNEPVWGSFLILEGDACGSYPAVGIVGPLSTGVTGPLGAKLMCGDVEITSGVTWFISMLTAGNAGLLVDPENNNCPDELIQAGNDFGLDRFFVDEPTNPNTTFSLRDVYPVSIPSPSGSFCATVRVVAVYYGTPYYTDITVCFDVNPL